MVYLHHYSSSPSPQSRRPTFITTSNPSSSLAHLVEAVRVDLAGEAASLSRSQIDEIALTARSGSVETN